MTAALATTDQVRALQATRRKAGIDDDTWRDRVRLVSGQDSTKGLTVDQAAALLRQLGGPGPARRSAISGPYASLARALWISAWCLTVVDDRRDSALLAWVERQTGYRTLAWVRTAEDGTKVIEALKAWIQREASLDWRSAQNPKWVVLIAIFRRLETAGEWRFEPAINPRSQIGSWAAKQLPGVDLVSDDELDKAIQAAGKWLRKAMGRSTK